MRVKVRVLAPVAVLAIATISACSLVTSLDGLQSAGVGLDGGADGAKDAAPDAAAPGLYVDANSGSDANLGTAAAPFKTLKHALLVAAKGDVVFLRPGTYDAANGDDFSGVIADGVEIRGTSSPEAGASAMLVGTGSQTAFSFAGGGAVSNVTLVGFFTAFHATSGTQSIQNAVVSNAVTAIDASGNAHLEAQALGVTGGKSVVNASGSATVGVKATLVQGTAADVGSAVFVESGTAALTLDQVTVAGATSDVVLIKDASSLTATGCNLSAVVNSATVVLVNVASTATGNATLNACTLAEGIAGISQASKTFALTMLGGKLSNTGTNPGNFGMSTRGPNDTVDGTEITGTRTAISVVAGGMTLKNAFVHQNVNGIYVQDAKLSMRGTRVTGNSNGCVYGFQAAILNLGAGGDLGNNVLTNSAAHALDISMASPTFVSAMGNVWNPGVQGADGAGKFGPAAVATGPSNGLNFSLAASQTVALAP